MTQLERPRRSPREAPLARLLVVAALAAPAARAAPAPDRAAADPVALAPEGGRTLSLADALTELDAQNLTLAQVRRRADEARALVTMATAPLLPTLAVTGSLIRNSDEAKARLGTIFDALAKVPGFPAGALAGAPGDLIIQPLQQVTGAASLRVPLIVPDAWFTLAAARQGIEAAAALTEATRRQLRAGLAQAAWSGWAAEEVVRATERGVEIAADHAATTERELKAGIRDPLASLAAQTELVRRKNDLVLARAALARARLQIGVLLGRPELVRVLLAAPEPAALAEPSALIDEALGARPELKAQGAQLRAAGKQLEAARWKVAPQVSASGSAFASDVPYPTGKTEGYRLSADLTWVLFDGGYRYGLRRQAAAQLDEARLGDQAQRLDIAREVQDALRDVGVAREGVGLAEQQHRLADDAAATARRSFAAGVASALDVRDANDRQYQADVALAGARARLGAAQVALGKAVGRDP